MIQSLRFSPDGKWLASGGFRTAKIWQRPEPVKKRDLAKLESLSQCLALAPNGQLLAVGEESGAIRLLDLQNGNVVRSFTGHCGTVRELRFHRRVSTVIRWNR